MRYFFFLFIWLSAYGVHGQTKLRHEADSLLSAFNYSAAATLYYQLQSSNDSVAAFRHLAQCLHKQGNYLGESRTLLRIPCDSLTHNDMRQLYYSYSNTQDSVGMDTWGRRILQLFPYDADIITSVVADLIQKNDVDSARLLAMHYLEKDTTNLNVLRQYAYSCYLLGDYAEAQRSYVSLYRNGWNGYEINLILGICYGEMGDANNAYNHLFIANQLKRGKDILVLKMLAKNSLKIGMVKEAVSYMEQAIKLAVPDSITVFGMYNSLAEAHFYLHDYEQAIIAFTNALKYNPTNALTYYNIAQMYNGLKDEVRMTKYYKLFLSYSSTLKNTDDNKEMIERVKAFLAEKK